MGEMPGWLDKLRKPNLSRVAKEPLRGAPAMRRLKTYAALSGYVYEYFFEGHRDVRGGREFVFSVTGDRKSWFAFAVHLAGDATADWERERARVLGDRERYAIAKLALFSAFDERPNPAELGTSVEVATAMARALLEKLDL
jgi:hypothetical protein